MTDKVSTERGEANTPSSPDAVLELVEALEKAIGDIQWMSAASDFDPRGKAHAGWLKVLKRLGEYDTALSRYRSR